MTAANPLLSYLPLIHLSFMYFLFISLKAPLIWRR